MSLLNLEVKYIDQPGGHFCFSSFPYRQKQNVSPPWFPILLRMNGDFGWINNELRNSGLR